MLKRKNIIFNKRNDIKKIQYNKGFTILEAIIVLAVIAILVLLASPKFINYVKKAQLVRIQHDVRVMEDKMRETMIYKSIDNWEDNAKNLDDLASEGRLFEREGIVTKVQIPKNGGYKIIPTKYKKAINTKLPGTFYTDDEAKVYYESDKPMTGEKEPVNRLVCATPESLGYSFEIIDGLGTITKWSGKEVHLVIPESFLLDVNGTKRCVPVQAVKKGAFMNGSLKEVIIPETVEVIEDDAFADNELEDIKIPDSVKHIGNGAFKNNNLTSVVIPHSVERIDDYAFSGNNLTNVIINNQENNINNGKGISNNVFGGGSTGSSITPTYKTPTAKDVGLSISTFTNPRTGKKSVSIKGGSKNKSKGKSLVIPDTINVDGEDLPVTDIESGAFQGYNLISVKFPKGLVRIEDYSFAGNRIEKVNLPDNIEYVGNYAFAYNEEYPIDGNGDPRPTIESIDIKGNQYINKLDKYGNVLDKPEDIELKDYLFVTTNNDIGSGNKPGDKPAEKEKKLKLSIDNKYLDDKTDILVSYSYEGEILAEEWLLNGEKIDKKPTGKLSPKSYTLQLRIKHTDIEDEEKQEKGWTKWERVDFKVHEYTEFEVNTPGSLETNKYIGDYEIGTNFVFNYTNDDKLEWNVPKSGLYKVNVMGAGAGGRGARVTGYISLSQNDKLNLKIHEKSNGGGVGGSGWASHYKGTRGGNGSGGTLLKLNESLILAAGGSGGNGGNGDGYHVSGKGGIGGHGGNLQGLSGASGGRSAYNDRWDGKSASGGSGGSFTTIAQGGCGGGSYDGTYNGGRGGNGPTHYDGAGGGGAGGRGSYWPGGAGGGGAGGRSFIDEKLVLDFHVDEGYNSSNGKVILTLISK